MDSTTRSTIARLAAGQHGVITREELRAHQVPAAAIQHMVASGRLREVSRRVFVVEGSPPTWRQRAFASIADSRGVGALSHESAAALWGMPGFAPGALHVLVPRGGLDPRRTSLARIHSTRRLPAHHLVELDGIRVTSPVRTVFDLSAELSLGKLARVLDDAWGMRLLRADALYDTLDELRGRGRGRVAWMRLLIEERGRTYAAPESGLERAFRRLLDHHGQAPMEYQVDLGGDGWVARVDALDRRARLVVQIDGDRFHTALLDRRHDEAQDAALRALGWTVLRVTERDLRERPAVVVARVAAARAGGAIRLAS